MKYFSFSVEMEEWVRWIGLLPTPSFQKTLSSSEGEGVKLLAVYELKYRLANSGDWYTLDRLKRSYESNINGIIWHDHIQIDGLGWDVYDMRYTLQQLQALPLDEVRYPTIIKFPRSKKTFRPMAFFFAKRLKYERLLSYTSVMGFLYAMNDRLKVGDRLKARSLDRFANDILEKSSQWEEKLSRDDLKMVRSGLGVKRGEQLKEQKEVHIQKIKDAIESGEFTKPNGAVNKSKIADALGLDRVTIMRLMPFVLMALLVILWIRPTMNNPLSLPLFGVVDYGAEVA